MAPLRHEIMSVRESKVITIKTLGLNQKHITHFKRCERNANTGAKIVTSPHNWTLWPPVSIVHGSPVSGKTLFEEFYNFLLKYTFMSLGLTVLIYIVIHWFNPPVKMFLRDYSRVAVGFRLVTVLYKVLWANASTSLFINDVYVMKRLGLMVAAEIAVANIQQHCTFRWLWAGQPVHTVATDSKHGTSFYLQTAFSLLVQTQRIWFFAVFEAYFQHWKWKTTVEKLIVYLLSEWLFNSSCVLVFLKLSQGLICTVQSQHWFGDATIMRSPINSSQKGIN